MSTVVLHVMEALGGGTARHLIDVVKHTPGVTHEVVVPRRRVGWLADDEALNALRLAGAHLHLVEMRRNPFHPRNMVALGALRRLIAARRPDIVHGHSSVGGALSRMAALGAGRPRVYTANALSPAASGLMFERILGRVTDRFIAVSDSEAQAVHRLGLVPPERLVTIPNGIDLEERPKAPFNLRQRLGVDQDALVVGTISRLVRQKAPEVFVRACAMIARAIPEARFIMIGSGPEQALVEREIARAGLESRLSLVPELPRPAAHLEQFDVFVSTSRFEGGPYTPLEAMRAGRPIVLTSATGNRDVVEDGVSGLLAPVDDAAALSRATVRLLEDSTLRRAVADAARTRLSERFDVRDMGTRLSRLYLELAPG